MKKYDAIIIDDDQENINLLKIYLKKYCKNIQICGESTNIKGGLELYYNCMPQILFLDISLGDDTIFSFLDSLENITGELIFISSHEEYALKAIKYEVRGYIMKPIKVNELVNIVNKAILNIEKKYTILQLQENDHESKEGQSNIVAIPSTDKIELIQIEDIVYLEADGRYTIFHLTNNRFKTSSRNLGEYEKILNRNVFFRIHYKYIVNLNMVVNINKSAGNYCELSINKTLPIAKRRQDELHRFLNLKL